MGFETALATPLISKITGSKNNFKVSEADRDETAYNDATAQARDAAVAQMQAGNGGGADQAAFIQAMQAQAAGKGPSLAQQQLQSAIQQNAAQAAGALAGAKGINPALAARMIAQNQAATNQQAAGQSAATRMAEQLNSQDLLAKALEARRAQDIAQQQATTGTLGTLGQLQGGQNALRVQSSLGAQGISAGVASQNAETNKQIFGGIMQGVGAGLAAASGGGGGGGMGGGGMGGMGGGGGGAAAAAWSGGEIGMSEGGDVPGMSGGGVWQKILYGLGKGAETFGKKMADQPSTQAADRFSGGPRANIPQVTAPTLDSMRGYGNMVGEEPKPAQQITPPSLQSMQGYGQMVGASPTPSSAPEPSADVEITPPSLESMAGSGGMARGGSVDFRGGGHVPGRARVKGDSPQNDTVDARLSPGEVVTKRSVAQRPGVKDALLAANEDPELADEFVRAIQAKKKGPAGYGRVLEAQRRYRQFMAEGGETEPEAASLQPPKKSWSEAVSDWWNATEEERPKAVTELDERALDSTTGMVKRAADAARKRTAALDEALNSGD